MIKKATLLIGAVLLGGFTGCLSPVTINKTEEVRFSGIPEVTRVDNGTANVEGRLRLGGYFSSKIDDPRREIYKEISADTSDWDEDVTIVDYRSIMYEPKGSFGADITYSFSEFFGLGGQLDYSSVNFKSAIDSSVGDDLNMVRIGVNGRFTTSNKYVSGGYRPEFYWGKFKGIKKEYDGIVGSVDSVLTLTSRDIYNKFFISFEQSVFLRVSPIEMVGMFVGFRHSVKPYAVAHDDCLYRNSFLFYGGVGAELLDMISLNFYAGVPVITENATMDEPPVSLGGSIGLMFNSKKSRGGTHE